MAAIRRFVKKSAVRSQKLKIPTTSQRSDSDLNPACMFNGDFEEEKKARGTCHIAMGNGFYYGQPARSTVHIDMVQYNPTVIFDEGTPEEVLIVKDGKVVCLGDK
ncbi:MAG: hypothetical protein ACLTR6_10815 [Clostridium fessum]